MDTWRCRKPSRSTSATMPLVEAGGVQVRGLLGLQQLGHEGRGNHHEAQAQAGRQHLGERAQVDRTLRDGALSAAPAAARRTTGRRRDRPRRSAGPARGRPAPAPAGAPRSSCGRSGSGSSAARTGSARRPRLGRQVRHVQPLRIAADRNDLGLDDRERAQRARVGGRLHQHPAAAVQQHLGHQVQALLRPGGDQDLRPDPPPTAASPRSLRAAACSLRWRRTGAPRGRPRAAPWRRRRRRRSRGRSSARAARRPG